MFRTITLRRPDECQRCKQEIPAGMRARWNGSKCWHLKAECPGQPHQEAHEEQGGELVLPGESLGLREAEVLPPVTIDYPRIRASRVCPLCRQLKDAGLVACWPCYRVQGMRNPEAVGSIVTEMLDARERELEEKAQFVVPTDPPPTAPPMVPFVERTFAKPAQPRPVAPAVNIAGRNIEEDF